jgi:uncharacterized membrane protein
MRSSRRSRLPRPRFWLKFGSKGVPSNLASAVRTQVVLVFAWAIVFATREQYALRFLEARSVLCLVLSGVGTGVYMPILPADW